MDSGDRSSRNPTIILKFNNPTMPSEQNESDYSDDDDEEVGQGYLQFGSYSGIKKKKTATSAACGGGDDGGGSVSGKRDHTAGGGGKSPPFCCQVESCGADLAVAKRYHRRHKVCEIHAKSPVVVVAGLLQRFCQQCSRFHEVSEFDEGRRSCRNRLAGHNERRRKSSSEDGSKHKSSSSLGKARPVGARSKVPTVPNQFQIH